MCTEYFHSCTILFYCYKLKLPYHHLNITHLEITLNIVFYDIIVFLILFNKYYNINNINLQPLQCTNNSKQNK